MTSKTGKAIKIMVNAYKKYSVVGQNSRIYKIMSWACNRYGITGSEANSLQDDILNGFIKA